MRAIGSAAAHGLTLAASRSPQALPDLHGPGNQIGRQTALPKPASAFASTRHPDRVESRRHVGRRRLTCRDWTSTAGFAMLGHSDKVAASARDSNSWNSAHLSEGCTPAAFRGHRRQRPLLLLRDRLGPSNARASITGAARVSSPGPQKAQKAQINKCDSTIVSMSLELPHQSPPSCELPRSVLQGSAMLGRIQGPPAESEYRIDFVCFDQIVLEIKALSATGPADHAQVISYLAMKTLRCGLLLNFGSAKLEHRRFIWEPRS